MEFNDVLRGIGDGVTPIEIQLERVRDSSAHLVTTVAALDEFALRAPSLLPGWSRAHVVVHLSRNADAQLRMIEAALRGERGEQYPGGEKGRAREIEEGVTADAEAVIAGPRSSVSALERRWTTLPEHAWELGTVTLRSRRTVREGITARWREVEIHHADLAGDYTPANWPMEFVEEFLGRTISKLPPRLLPGAAETGFRWRLVDRDTTHSWLVDTEAVGAGAGAADVEVSGSGWQLLAWLCGRGDHGLKVAGGSGRLPEISVYG
ncbi:maleylpyruvate isomerase family mycothiol-dependent enzyme [Actinomadura nitritigenes]|uniref:maleylpyruvate isomerase family mycothiol-dependent enzyme n=1 Tax=Actinomadura nitritigenes TaxID=134602 RepID=UPI003D923FCA